MPKQTIESLIEGGKATAAPPLGPALGPLGVNIGEVIAEINKKTAEFKGMQVPIKVTVDSDTKEFEISVGTPPASALIKQEAKIEKGSGNPKTELIADLKIEQIIKIAKMKENNLLGKDPIARVKEIIGTCNSMGIMVEGKKAVETIKDISKGAFKDKIIAGKTELTAEELKELEEEKKKLQEEIEKKRAEFEAKAKAILAEMQGKTTGEIKKKMREEGIPEPIIKENMPTEEAKPAGEEGEAAPAEEKKEEAKEEKK